MESTVSPTSPDAAPRFARILVAVDGSRHALRAARVAARLAAALGARLMLLTVYPVPSAALGEPRYSKALDEALEEARKTVDEARRVVMEAGGSEPETEWLGGDPIDTIVSSTHAGGYDLVVMGTRGRGRLGSAFLGSVSSAVAARAGRPVVVVGDGS